ncbi:MAG: MerR family transcriptional regulator, partial [Myxococcota bacterium]
MSVSTESQDSPEAQDPPLRMRDLCKASGLERQAIHFYIQQGLLPPGIKTGRNTAVYSSEHVERLHLIRQLKEEHFLPLKAIKAILDGRDDDFSPEQRAFLTKVKEELRTGYEPDPEREFVPIETVIEQTGLDRGDVDEAIAIGVVAASADGRAVLQRDV